MGSAFLDANDEPEPGAQGRGRRRSRVAKNRPGSKAAALLQTAGALLFIPQAALIALSVGRIANGGGLDAVLWPAIFIVILGIAKSCLEAAGGRLAFKAARAELSKRRAAAVGALARRSPVDPSRPASGEAASVIGEQAELIVPYIARFQPARFKATAVPLVMLVCIFPISWIAALILLIAMPLIPVFMALIGWRAQAASEKQLAATGGLNGFLLDRLRGLTTIRALGAVDQTATRLRADADDLKNRTMAVLRIAFLSSAVLELFAALGVALLAVYVGFSLLGEITFGAWTGGLDLTNGLFLLLLAPAFFEPLRDLSSVWHDRASGEAALLALDGIATGGLDIVKEADGQQAARFDIELDDAGFRYAADKALAIGTFSCRIIQGEHVALLGASGSGKSTLLALIAGLAPVSEGTVRIGGLPLGEAGDWRRHIAWIGQKPHIFAGSLAGNITLGRAATKANDALHAAKLEQVAAAYGKRPLGEGGLGLSGGEALRLAIARAACNPDIRIILADEPTAHLDAATAAGITDSLIHLAKGKTLVVATHDPRLAARMQRVIAIGAENLREAAE
ncbi:thiol reductant ABC exporter subunit CydD [Rhizobium sp. 21-4511-3d]